MNPCDHIDDRSRRIARMEEIYDRCSDAVTELQRAAEGYAALQEQLKELEHYYTSPMWMADFDADRAGSVPQDLKRGILTEDAIYDLLTDHQELQQQLRKLLHSCGDCVQTQKASPCPGEADLVPRLLKELAALPQVEAIALGGSRAGEQFDANSDYDIYLYCTGEVSLDEKKAILERYCGYMELSNHFWELEDNCTLKNGVDMDILYRNLDDFANDVASVVEQHHARNGYTTCMWHNLLTCKVLYDKNGRLTALKQRFQVPYPSALRENIISNNMKLLYDFMPAYYHQIKKAMGRGDWVSVNHRTTAFLESYFDIIWAINEQTHPGEKRQVSLANTTCSILPVDFEENIRILFSNLFSDGTVVLQTLERMVLELKRLLP